jgi:hypothetical protein
MHQGARGEGHHQACRHPQQDEDLQYGYPLQDFEEATPFDMYTNKVIARSVGSN